MQETKLQKETGVLIYADDLRSFATKQIGRYCSFTAKNCPV